MITHRGAYGDLRTRNADGDSYTVDEEHSMFKHLRTENKLDTKTENNKVESKVIQIENINKVEVNHKMDISSSPSNSEYSAFSIRGELPERSEDVVVTGIGEIKGDDEFIKRHNAITTFFVSNSQDEVYFKEREIFRQARFCYFMVGKPQPCDTNISLRYPKNYSGRKEPHDPGYCIFSNK